ncbi:MAG: His/Gly/Thr/Pro-type tRNA ligase C-terminal domain-containing protein [Candidatus Nanoarchaeia archaeon]|nr:His/Gly/Thr/Pro-type tRNA ligase C-terminal domain-containing protein [Candidatus Nanoarchaeia archaeon]
MIKQDSTYEKISSKSDFSKWYNDALSAAGILDQRYEMKGMIVWLPYGLSIMKSLINKWDELFSKNGIKEAYFPQIVPIKYCEINESWWEGFKTEGYKVIAGSEGEIQGALRPTGEPAIYPMFSMWTRSANDLPIKIYQTVNSFRYETKQTRPLIRAREITHWFEIHTAHSTKQEAENELKAHLKIMDYFYEEMLALPIFMVNKPIWDCFPGSVGAFEYYSLMPDGKVMENGSANNLGQAYAKKFEIKYKNDKGLEEYAWMICTGNGARFLAAAISEFGDDKGLILPPRIAPIQATIIPIIFKGKEKKVFEQVKKMQKELSKMGIKYETDSRSISPGRKYYDWEVKGIPLRIDVGPKDVDSKKCLITIRFSKEKLSIKLNELKKIKGFLDKIHEDMLKSSRKRLHESIIFTSSKKDLIKAVDSKKIAKVYWCGNKDCYDKISSLGEGYEGFGTSTDSKGAGKCLNCQKTSYEELFIAKSY